MMNNKRVNFNVETHGIFEAISRELFPSIFTSTDVFLRSTELNLSTRGKGHPSQRLDNGRQRNYVHLHLYDICMGLSHALEAGTTPNSEKKEICVENIK